MERFIRVVFGISIILLSSCNKETDETAPQINTINLNGSKEDIYLPAGSSFDITAQISDDMELAQMKLDIHNNFDGHNHKNDLQEFQFLEIYDLDGTLHSYSETVAIPENAIAGPYHTGLYAIDQTGNESDEAFLNLIITRADAPQVTFTSPDFSASPSYSTGDTIKLQGIVMDDESLEKVIVSLKEINGDDEIYEEEYDLSTSTPQSWDMQSDGSLNIPIQPGFTPALYSLLVRAEDNLGNITLHRESVNITE